MAGLEQQLQALTTTLTAASTRETELRQEVVRLGTLPAAAVTAPRSSGTIDTRSLGKPDHFDGEEKKWEDCIDGGADPDGGGRGRGGRRGRGRIG
jgi:hypothetical protein